MKSIRQVISHAIIFLYVIASCLFFIVPANAFALTNSDAKTELLTSWDIKPPHFKENIQKPGLFLISGSKGWLASLYAPYFQMLKKDNRMPAVLGISNYYNYNKTELKLFVEQTPVESLSPAYVLRNAGFSSPQLFTYPDLNNNPTQAAIEIWEKYTVKSPDIVVSTIDDLENFTQASLFAAHFQLPLLPLDTMLAQLRLKMVFSQKQVNRVFLFSDNPPSDLSFFPKEKIRKLNRDLVTRLLLDKIGKENVKNVLLTRVEGQQFSNISRTDDALFFLPYISLLRNAPVVFSPARAGRSAQTVLNEYLADYDLRPRNITIFGNYSRVETVEPREELLLRVYDKEIELEPGTNYRLGYALDYGIGRLPYNQFSRVSLYYTRLRIHDELYKTKPRNFVMISNLIASEGATLLFAEAVSKLTVKELRNFELQGKSFYATDPEDQKIWDAALNSSLVIYEGHSNHFLALGSDENLNFLSQDPTYYSKYPLLILQSCNSLDELDILANQGPIAVVGSSTRVHSASGSSFIKAYLDSTLYENPITLGEALRDAKNYFLSIVELKQQRGHNEQSKANRVALSFRVWGDPEITLFPYPLIKPQKSPVQANMVNNKMLELKTPGKFYNYIRNDKYRLHSFPMSKQAGIVKSSKNQVKDTRRIESFYFAKLPFEVFKGQDFNRLKRGFGIGDVRNVIMPDSLNRWVYFLHYPKKEKKNSTIQIQLGN
jgi:hypothetical protein